MGLGDNAFFWLNSWSSTAGMLLIFILWLFLWLTRREVDEAERRTGIPAAGGALPLLGHLPQVFKLVGRKSEITIYNILKKTVY
uniref:Uncharacterized protein n=1 Tax=Magallana gigas TaxID=29159 RepID=A0A8W8KSM7_MAGGI